MTIPEDNPGPIKRVANLLMLCVAAFLIFQLISLDLSWPNQMILGGVSILIGLVANRLSPSRRVTIALMLISTTATLRYGWWRVHLLIDYFSDESNPRVGLDAAFLLILILAEAYTVLIMFLGYMQTVWPLRRKPLPMPVNDDVWPHVDILIPTYNEPLSLVRYTALAANSIDYPQDKLHVYILDDGSRKDFAAFARQAGVGYITRLQHAHAKAGNINHALSTMGSPYVAIFDCDHVPTRSFLQMTLGWMLADPQLAMLQTPHHFYSPDPFERNLQQYKTIPNEAELFYGIVQDGNDFWNATFFCGSCALIRRSALDEVGGIATETVTEDAHTSLRMQKLGYNTAYINIPQAAGLATETLSAHVGQRIRWARGMIQILRTDNPLFGGKMKFTQRLCYFNAMAHFLYAVPRLVFLGAPLAYLLLGRTIIPGYWVAILVYAFPHLILSSMTNSRVQGSHRHSFWNEIYESVLAPYILAPTLLAFINPKLGKFNVTDKGNTLAQTRFDNKIAAPTKWMLLFNFFGLVSGIYRLIVFGSVHTGAVVMNLVWIIFNMIILGVAAAVAHEQRQRRESVRIQARIPIRFDLPDGRSFSGVTTDMSIGGASVQIAETARFTRGQSFRIAFPEQAGDAEIGARVVAVSPVEVRLSFSVPTIPEQETLTRALYSRADAWISRLTDREVDRPLVSLWRVIRLSIYGIYQILRSLVPAKAMAQKPETPKNAVKTAAILLVACLAGFASHALSAAQAFPASAPAPTRSATAPQPAAQSDPEQVGASSMVQALRFTDLGLNHPIQMRGPHSYYSVHFTLSYAMNPRQASLQLRYRTDISLNGQTAPLKVTLNGVDVASLPAASGAGQPGGFQTTTVPLPETYLVRGNTLTFEFTGSGVMEQEDQAKTHILLDIAADSSLEIRGDTLPWGGDLAQLPLPIFDTGLQTPTVVPFVFLSQPGPKQLEAAGAVASWLGILASTSPVRFSVSLGSIPPGNAVVFSADPTQLPASLQPPAGSAPVLMLKPNPSDANAKVLVLAGADDDQLLNIARTLSLTRGATTRASGQGLPLASDATRIPVLAMPPPRALDDAPRWLPTRRETPLENCQNLDTLQTEGSSPVPLYFHVPPDLSYGERENLSMHLYYRYNAAPITAGSALRVVINGVLVSEIPLIPGAGVTNGRRTVLVPVADLRPFGNTILFNFDFIPLKQLRAPDLHGEILCNSSLDLQELARWTAMPNLELFANAGFPFTQMADLSETTVILPNTPSADEIGLYLHLMGHFGAQTGYPALRVTVAGPNTPIGAGHNYLILGAAADQPALNSLDALLPVTVDSNGLHVKQPHPYLAYASSLQDAIARRWAALFGNTLANNLPIGGTGLPEALVEEIPSPAAPDRSIVVVAVRDNGTADEFESIFLDRSQSQDISGSISVLNNAKFTSYAGGGNSYHVGDISKYNLLRIWLTQHFLILYFSATVFSFLLANWIYFWLKSRAQQRLELETRRTPAA